MKDLEKIKSEDLGCQVQDANPANFAIEQEVAQLVGATVPAPTEPSADDARELGAQLLVFLRRALLPIQTALRTAVAAIYAHLDSRCTDYTPAAYAPYSAARRAYDPMGTLPARSVANLLTALTAFSARKISNGSAPNDGIKDGVSLAHLMNDPSIVTKLEDDNTGWTLTYNPVTKFPNLTEFSSKCSKVSGTIIGVANPSLPLATEYSNSANYVTNITASRNFGMTSLKKVAIFASSFTAFISTSGDELDFGSLERIEANGSSIGGSLLPSLVRSSTLKVLITNLKTFGQGGWAATNGYTFFCTSPLLERLVLGKLQSVPTQMFYYDQTHTFANLIDLEIGLGTAVNLNFSDWNPTNVLADADKTATFLQNFKEHIALRLTSNGTGKTLTLSQAVFDTIWNQDGTPKSTDPDSVIYQINKIIKTDKHWSVNRA